MNIEINKMVVDGKALQLKVINQLKPLLVSESTPKDICFGYYIVKKQKQYIFQSNNELKIFTDYKFRIAKSTQKQIYGTGNRFKNFTSNEDRDTYFLKLQSITDKLLETQLFY